MIGHLNLGGGAAPGCAARRRVMFTTLENQGRRDDLSWACGAFIPTAPTGTRSSALSYHGLHFNASFRTRYCRRSLLRRRRHQWFWHLRERCPWNGNLDPFVRDSRRTRATVRLPSGCASRDVRLTNVPFSPQGMEQLTLWVNDGDATAQQQVKGGPWIGKVTIFGRAGQSSAHRLECNPLGDHDVDAAF